MLWTKQFQPQKFLKEKSSSIDFPSTFSYNPGKISPIEPITLVITAYQVYSLTLAFVSSALESSMDQTVQQPVFLSQTYTLVTNKEDLDALKTIGIPLQTAPPASVGTIHY